MNRILALAAGAVFAVYRWGHTAGQLQGRADLVRELELQERRARRRS